jgi:CobD/CbiB protein
MVGHRSERHLRFGWASARLDDLVNWPAARLAALAAIAWAPAVGGDRRAAWSAAWRDGAAHPSPNAGRIEGAFAGALGVRLGGLNVRHAQVPPAHALPTEIARLSERQAFGIRGEAWGHDVLDELDAYIAPAVGISAPSGATDASGPNVTADDFRALALGFDSASVSTRDATVAPIKEMAASLSLDEVLTLARSRKPAERVGAAIALGFISGPGSRPAKTTRYVRNMAANALRRQRR